MVELHYLPQFHEDLQEIWLAIAVDDISAADRILFAIYDRCEILTTDPNAGPRRPDISSECRCLVEGTYLILYKHAHDRVTLVRAMHGHRELTSRDFPAQI